MTHYIPNDPTPAPRAEIIRRQDIIDQVGGLLTIYQEQQRQALQIAQADATRGGFLSDANTVAERRKLSRMYLLTYSGVSALTMGGVAYLANLAGTNGSLSLAGWMVGTGALTLILVWTRHGDEFKHSPEGIARHLADWHGSIADYEARTRRKALQWEFAAEHDRQQAALAAADAGRRDAELRIAELEARRRLVNTQNDANHAWSTEPAEVAPRPSPLAPASTWQQDLAVWLAGLYTDPDAITEAGVIKGRTPWAQRSPWLDADKQAARRACCDLRPSIIESADGGRWRLRTEMFPTADIAVRLLSQRLADP